jgi:hypothetical protein
MGGTDVDTDRRKVLFIGGSLNQTTMMHKIGQELEGDFECWFTSFYTDGWLDMAVRLGMTDYTTLGNPVRRMTETFLRTAGVRIDRRGERNMYDLVVTCTDLVVPKNIRRRKIVLVQEGMMDPANWRFKLVRTIGLPRFLANTSTTGLSHVYQRFCVASEGFKQQFIDRGVDPEGMVVTGIPNFDNVTEFLDNDFPHRGYVMAATSCLRETFKPEDRRGFIRKTLQIADGRPVLFKLHPNERPERAIREIRRQTREAIIYPDGNTNHMVANCDVFVTKYSSVVLVASALGKEIHSDLNAETLARLTPIQNGGRSARIIANICREIVQ